jgi:hypothetical protein
MLVASQRHLLFKWPHPGSAFRGSDVFCFLLKNEEEEEEEEEEDHKEERGKHPRGGRPSASSSLLPCPRSRAVKETNERSSSRQQSSSRARPPAIYRPHQPRIFFLLPPSTTGTSLTW